MTSLGDCVTDIFFVVSFSQLGGSTAEEHVVKERNLVVFFPHPWSAF